MIKENFRGAGMIAEPGMYRKQTIEKKAVIDPTRLGLIGTSQALNSVVNQIQKVACTDANVLILGENGTGKEVVANALHRLSNRRGATFLPVDMGAVTETLFESELFGHKKGSFTDAFENRMGKFEAANGGTLFLDEIGNLPLSLQAKLLNVLQQRHVVRIGSNVGTAINVRLICATNQPIHHSVAEKRFRADLLYRINTVEIFLPPLRARKEDIRMLAEYYRAKFSAQYNPEVLTISEAAIRLMESYDWPGNVRELMHKVERAVIMTESAAIQPCDLQFSTATESSDRLVLETLNLEDVERQVIDVAMAKHGGNISCASNELGLTRATLYRRLKKYDLYSTAGRT